MNFEDHFSQLAETYSKYRPGYPSSLFEYLTGLCKTHNLAWDCGTGNGQAALELTKYFTKVIATDASASQIEKAFKHQAVEYRVEQAESTSLLDSSVDLTTVSVAVHWFDFDRFYQEVRRVSAPGGIIAVWSYHLLRITPDIDSILDKYMTEVLEGYWPDRFVYVNTGYKTLPFPFREVLPPKFEMTTEWNLEQVAGFLSSWSAVKNYLEKTGRHPLNEVWDDLKSGWGNEENSYKARWPLNVRIGIVNT